MGGACDMHGELERCMQGFVRETSGTEDQLEVLGLHGREILKTYRPRGSGQGQKVASCEYGTSASGSMIGTEYPE
jgi:hypothetical protein